MKRMTIQVTFRFLSSLFLFSLITVSSPALAQQNCQNNTQTDKQSDLVQYIIAKLHEEHVILAVCMPSPVHIDQSYAVLISREEKPACEEEEETCNYSLSLLLVDNRSGDITRSYTQKNTLIANASIIKDVALDTNIYQLNPSLRATGLRIDREQFLHSSTIASTELHLFIENGDEFQSVFSHSIDDDSKVLAGLLLIEDEKNKDSTPCWHYQGVVTRSIEFGTYHDGFRDLVVKMDAQDITGKRADNTCRAETIAVTTGKTTIPFDSRSYLLPIWLSYPR